ncbi:MAG: AraC family transcriptional regulator [Rhizobium sp.]|nr:AraC family transcriptional regulator [Rhizobium sp.]
MPNTVHTAGMNPPSASPGPMEVRFFSGALAPAEWTFRGRRSRVFLLQSGAGHVRMGRHDVPISAPSIVWAPAGVTGSIVFDAGAEGATMAVPDVTLGSAMPMGAVFAQVREAILRPILGARISALSARELGGTLRAIERELRDDEPGAQEVIRHHLALALISVWRLADRGRERARPSPRAIVRGFVHLMELHLREHMALGDYARLLGVTADRLNTAVRRTTGRSPMELIHGRLMTEAIVLFDNSGLQVAEIAEHLGFKDAAYFSRFFKRMAGVSPRAYRDGITIVKDETSPNFAAWP